MHEGASVVAWIMVHGSLLIRPTQWDRRAFTRELSKARRHHAREQVCDRRTAQRGSVLTWSMWTPAYSCLCF
ncbi:MAG: hypothetical protein ACKO3C_05760 [Betaproteobacteria bacterium]